MHLKILSPDRIIFDGNVDRIQLPGHAGEMGILDEHAPLMTRLQTGTIRLFQGNKLIEEFLIQGGYAAVNSQECHAFITF